MLSLILLILVITTIVFAAETGEDEVDMKSAFVHLVQNFSDIQSTLEALPRECTKLGRTYKEGEDFIIGNLRYKCRKYGVYTIEGCVTDQKENLKIGEAVVRNNIKSQCLGVHFSTGSSVFYRETPCGTLGVPKCDQIGPPKSYEEARKEAENTANFTGISMPGLPPGWTIIDQRQQTVPGSNKRMLSRTLLYNVAGSPSRVRRQSWKFPSAAASTKVGTEKPPQILRVALGDGKIINVTRGSTSKTKPNVIYTQTVSRTLNIVDNKNSGKTGTGSKDSNSNTPTIPIVKGPEPKITSG